MRRRGHSESYNRAFSSIREHVNDTVHKERKAITTGEVVETVVNTSGDQWADEEAIEEVTPEAKEDEKYLHIYHTAKMI